MDYKQAAEELFEMVILSVGMVEDVEAFNALCNRYPELMSAYVAKIEEEIKDVEIPEETEEEKREHWEQLKKKIRERCGEDAI